MDFFDELNRSVSGISKVGGLKSLIRDEQKKITSLYVEIGTRYYESNKNNPTALYAPQIAGINEALEKIEGYNQQIYLTRGGAPAGAVCSKCGRPMTSMDKFCASCGTPVGGAQPKTVLCCKCGAMLSEGSVFCAICGAKQEASKPQTEVCKKCGATIEAGFAFCVVCGTKKGEGSAAEVETPVQSDQPACECQGSAKEDPAEEICVHPEECVCTVTEEETCEVVELQEECDAPEKDETEPVTECTEQVSQDFEIAVEDTSDETEENPYEYMLRDNVCKVCNKELSPTSKFCMYCGAKR